MTITEEDLTAALRQLNEELNSSPSKDEFTINQFAEANGFTRGKVRGILNQGVKDGKLTMRKIGQLLYFRKVLVVT